MNIRKSNRRIPYVAGFFLIGSLLALTTEGQAWNGDRRLNDQIAQYHVFMDEHSKAATRIRENPLLVYDKKFLKSHPEVERFLKARPELREEIGRRPGRVFAWYDRDGYRYGRNDRRFGWFNH